MSVNAVLVFLPRDRSLPEGIAALLVIYALINLPCISVWAFAGDRLRRWLAQPRALRLFNGIMGGLMALTALWLAVEELLA